MVVCIVLVPLAAPGGRGVLVVVIVVACRRKATTARQLLCVVIRRRHLTYFFVMARRDLTVPRRGTRVVAWRVLWSLLDLSVLWRRPLRSMVTRRLSVLPNCNFPQPPELAGGAAWVAEWCGATLPCLYNARL